MRIAMLPVGLVTWALAALPGTASAQPTFTPAEIAGWQLHSFVGHTHYEYVTTSEGPAVYARCDSASASGLFRRKPIDLTETPVIEWRWRVENIFAQVDETAKSGDDYPARIYVIDEHPMLPWRTRALAYVRSSDMGIGADWPNAYANQVRMIAVASGEVGLGSWQTHRRNVRRDFQRYHGREIAQADAIAIMSDCDSARQSSEAWYGAIRLLPR